MLGTIPSWMSESYTPTCCSNVLRKLSSMSVSSPSDCGWIIPRSVSLTEDCFLVWSMLESTVIPFWLLGINGSSAMTSSISQSIGWVRLLWLAAGRAAVCNMDGAGGFKVFWSGGEIPLKFWEHLVWARDVCVGDLFALFEVELCPTEKETSVLI